MAEPADAAARIDAMLTEFAASGDPRLRQRAEELVRALMEFYDAGLGRLVELLEEQPGSLLRTLAADDVVGGLLILHDLHPASTQERVSAALERVRPYLGSHAGDVELLGVDDAGVVRLRLAGSCNGCPSSSVTVTLAIEQAIDEMAPEVTRVDVEGVAAPPVPRGVGGPGGRTSLPLLTVGAPPASPSWVTLADPAGVAAGTVAALVVGDTATLVANLGGGLYAYRDRCPACGAALAAGALDGDLLTCPGCARRFDLRRAGAAVGAGGEEAAVHLQPLPLLAERGAVRVAVPVGAGA